MAASSARATSARAREQVSTPGAVRLGVWLALLTAAVSAVFTFVAIATPARSGPFCVSGCIPAPYFNVARYIPGDYLWLIPGILLAPVFLGLMAYIESHMAEAFKTLGRIALSLAAIYAAVIMVDYFVQFAVVIPSLQSGETQNLSLFTQYNPHGFFIALEVVAYLAMSAAFLAAAPLFVGGWIEWMIRWLFVLSFASVAAAFVGFWLIGHDLIAVEVTVLLINWIALIVGGVLLSIAFRRGVRS